MENDVVSEVLLKVEHLTKAPEKYLSVQEDSALQIRQLTKKLYDFNKKKESNLVENSSTLKELILENLDEEQIWQQIELQNNFIRQEFIHGFAEFLAKKKDFQTGINHEDSSENDNAEESKNEDDPSQEMSGSEREAAYSGAESFGSSNDAMSDSEISHTEEDDHPFKSKEKSIVDDKFFKLSEMEKFLQREERKKKGEEEGEEEDEIIDYFENMSSDSNDESERFNYDDFFDQPDDVPAKKKRKKKENSEFEKIAKKKVKFSMGSDAEVEQEDDSDNFNEDSDINKELKTGNKGLDVKSTFEARQERLKNRIKALEAEALSEKPWQLKGEVTASSRPQNSLLEEYVEFDTAARPAPVMTEKSTLKLEDIIKQRIKDKAWDDVERKIKPVENPKEYKKRLVLDQEKSKLSLAQIYEHEYMKQKEAKSENIEDKPDEVPNEHLEINKMLKTLFTKLDALSNLHFTPNMASTEVKIISNLPAIMVEEVAPVATSDAALLAPEEVKSKVKGDLIGKSERTTTDKRRERRIKKKRQKMKQKEIEKREKGKVEKVKTFSKKSKKIPKKLIKKLGQSANVTQLSPGGDGKYIRTSNAFFSMLQDDVKKHIKEKSEDTKKFQKNKKLDVKKLKL